MNRVYGLLILTALSSGWAWGSTRLMAQILELPVTMITMRDSEINGLRKVRAERPSYELFRKEN